MKPHTTIREALTDPALLGNVLAGESWAAWRALLIAAMGEVLTETERELFARLTDRPTEPLQRVEELWAVVGRRGGKTRAAAVLAVYLATMVDHRANLSPGERGLVLFLAQNQRAAQIAFGYAAAIFDDVPLLSTLVASKTADTLSLSNGIDLEIRAASFRGLRGVTAVAAIADELAFWYSDECGIEYFNADKVKSDIYLGALPALMSRKVDLLDNVRVISQICGLERSTGRGKDSVDHRKGARDDLANSVLGVTFLLTREWSQDNPLVAPIFLSAPRTHFGDANYTGGAGQAPHLDRDKRDWPVY